MRPFALRLLVQTVLVLPLAYPALLHADAGARQASLYDRLGGSAAIASIADELIDRAAHDPRTRQQWRKVSLHRVKDVLAQYLCAVTEGPCTYTGDTMRDVHAGLNITEAQMYAGVEILRSVMIAHEIPIRERNEFLALLAPLKNDIVTR